MNTQTTPSHRASLAVWLCCAVLASATFAGSAQAATVTLSGTIGFQKQVVQIDFSLAAPGTDVKIWTDSWQSGLNFDPSAAVWAQSAADHTLLADVDDDDTIAANQGFFDTGFKFDQLAAGSYRLTLVASSNLTQGTLLSQGFLYDNAAPIALIDWNQPGYDINTNDQKGGFWRVSFSGVDQAAVVPEPTTALLLGLGLAGVMMWRRRVGS